ncbi:hypothetical protein E4U32_005233 [Claviceps aff. humidiphila group G2b]|nr:hypothetical protein E4U32_005233 [Claviceps aff. humidiphila group G2b]
MSRWEGGEEAKNKLARFYERGKADMWAQIAAELAVPWSEAERIHWIIGKAQIAKRGSDDSFRTNRVNISPFQLVDALVQARRQQQQQQGFKKSKLEWSGEEETFLFACQRSGMGWETISRLLPGRTAKSCHKYHQIQSQTGPTWNQERKNKLCKMYESLKPSMWAKIGEELTVPWEIAEYMHWHLGANFLAKRAGVPLRFQAAFRLAPLQHDNAEMNQHWDQYHDQLSRHHHPALSQTGPGFTAREGRPETSVTLPSFADFIVGVELSFLPPSRETYRAALPTARSRGSR